MILVSIPNFSNVSLSPRGVIWPILETTFQISKIQHDAFILHFKFGFIIVNYVFHNVSIIYNIYYSTVLIFTFHF